MLPLILDAPDNRPLGHVEDDDLRVGLVGAVLDLETNVFKVLRIPQRMEIAAERILVHRVTDTGEDTRLQRLAPDPAIALEFDALDDGGFLRVCGGRLRLLLRGSRQGLACAPGIRPQPRASTQHSRAVRAQRQIMLSCGQRTTQGRFPRNNKFVRSPAGPR